MMVTLPAGAIVIATGKNSVWNEPAACSLEQRGANALGSQPCRELGFAGVNFRGNTAVNAGGAVFASDPDNVWVSEEVSRACSWKE